MRKTIAIGNWRGSTSSSGFSNAFDVAVNDVKSQAPWRIMGMISVPRGLRQKRQMIGVNSTATTKNHTNTGNPSLE
jgi:hypothetical protein